MVYAMLGCFDFLLLKQMDGIVLGGLAGGVVDI